jgi:hypothetical protein
VNLGGPTKFGYYDVNRDASSQRRSFFVETLARFRPDFTLLAELEGKLPG